MKECVFLFFCRLSCREIYWFLKQFVIKKKNPMPKSVRKGGGEILSLESIKPFAVFQELFSQLGHCSSWVQPLLDHWEKAFLLGPTRVSVLLQPYLHRLFADWLCHICLSALLLASWGGSVLPSLRALHQQVSAAPGEDKEKLSPIIPPAQLQPFECNIVYIIPKYISYIFWTETLWMPHPWKGSRTAWMGP